MVLACIKFQALSSSTVFGKRVRELNGSMPKLLSTYYRGRSITRVISRRTAKRVNQRPVVGEAWEVRAGRINRSKI
jgi:hypothetical protein